MQRALNFQNSYDAPKLLQVRNILDSLCYTLEHRVFTTAEQILEDDVVNDAFDAVCKLRQLIDRPRCDATSRPSSVSTCEHLRSEIYEDIVSAAGYTKCTLRAPVTIKPSLKISSAKDERHSLPQATITVTSPCTHLFPPTYDGTDATTVASWFQTVFDKPMDECTDHESDMAASLAEAITQALHSRTGFGVVYNHNEALFLQVVCLEPVLRERIVIRVSRVFRCEDNLSTLFGIAALFQVVEMRGTAQKLFDGEVFSCVRMLSCSGADLVNPTVATRRECSSNERKSSASGQDDASDNESEHASVESEHECNACALPPIEDEETKMLRTWTDDNLVSQLYTESCGVLGSGGCGMVKKSREGNTRVALKYWNQRHGTGEQLLLREIKLYCLLATKHEELMGVAIPRLIAVGTQDWVGPVLVTERVGEPVKNIRGRLHVGGRLVGKEDCIAIRDCAIQGLEAMHSCGVVHRDVEMRNLRAKWIGEKEGFWRTWWVDLGLARICEDAARMTREITHCRRIFEDSYKEVHHAQ